METYRKHFWIGGFLAEFAFGTELFYSDVLTKPDEDYRNRHYHLLSIDVEKAYAVKDNGNISNGISVCLPFLMFRIHKVGNTEE